jgi:hypothetical protein
MASSRTVIREEPPMIRCAPRTQTSLAAALSGLSALGMMLASVSPATGRELELSYQRGKVSLAARAVSVREVLDAFSQRTGIPVECDEASAFKTRLVTVNTSFARRDPKFALERILADLPYTITYGPDRSVRKVQITTIYPRVKGLEKLARPPAEAALAAAAAPPPALPALPALPTPAEPPAPPAPPAPAAARSAPPASAETLVADEIRQAQERLRGSHRRATREEPGSASASAAGAAAAPAAPPAAPATRVEEPLKPELADAAERVRRSALRLPAEGPQSAGRLRDAGIDPDEALSRMTAPAGRPGPAVAAVPPSAAAPPEGAGAPLTGDASLVLARSGSGQTFLSVGEFNAISSALKTRGKLGPGTSGEMIERVLTLKVIADLARRSGYESVPEVVASLKPADGSGRVIALAEAIMRNEAHDIRPITDEQAAAELARRPQAFPDAAKAPPALGKLLVKQVLAMEKWTDRVETHRRGLGISRAPF